MFGYLIDMDGVIYRGGTSFPGRGSSLRCASGGAVSVFTNNSQRTRRDVAVKLQHGLRRVARSTSSPPRDGDGAVLAR